MNPTLRTLPVLVINPHGFCNCRCAMCDIWKRAKLDEIGADHFDRQLSDIEALGVRWVVFSGGEPLLHADLFRKAAELRRRGIRLTLLSSGLLLGRHAARIVEHFDEVIVSLDGPRAVHDLIRGVSRAFDVMGAGILRLREELPEFPLHARCTVQRGNCAHLTSTVDAARQIGANSISFLASDIHSQAFNRQPLPLLSDSNSVALRMEDLPQLDAQIAELTESGLCGGYIRESPAKLRKIADHFRAYLEQAVTAAPQCNAPWNSAVLEADGRVRPCFFHAPFGKITGEMGLSAVINGKEARDFRSNLNVDRDPICRKCVCSLNYSGEG